MLLKHSTKNDGQQNKVLVIAEAGVNHNGSLDMALQLVDEAAKAGADFVKFQTFKTEKVICKSAPKAEYQTSATGTTESQYEMVKQFELSEAQHQTIIDHCNKVNIQFLSTPFDLESVNLLAKIFDLPILKIPSGEITHAPLLLNAAQTGKPVILSTGMSTLGEIESALAVLAFGYIDESGKAGPDAFRLTYQSIKGQAALKEKVTLLHCTTEYPSPFEDTNLKAMDVMKAAFGLPVGFSDHTRGITASIAAAARGAAIIEKHFTLDKKLSGPDHKASLEPGELQELVSAVRTVEKALGSGRKHPSPSEIKNIPIARKSLVAAGPIKKGEMFSKDNLTAKRPGNGISPMRYWDILGTAAKRNYREDELID